MISEKIPPVIYYHSKDHDGVVSASILYHAIHWTSGVQAELCGWDRTDPLPPLPKHGQTVFMTDILLPPKFIREAVAIVGTRDFYWIDHHETSMQIVKDMGLQLSGIRSNELSAIELVWKWCFHKKWVRQEEPPPVAKHLGRWDRWDHSDPETTIVHYGCTSFRDNMDPANPAWKTLLGFRSKAAMQDMYEQVLARGVIIEENWQNYNKVIVPLIHIVVLDGIRFMAINHPPANSKIFGDAGKDLEHDACLIYSRTNDARWRVSLYKSDHSYSGEDLNLAKVAEKYGGGGNPNAAGFRVRDWPWTEVNTTSNLERFEKP